MPFTLAHPVAVLPLSGVMGRLAVLSALIIGSMTPDAPYFLALDIDRGDTHSLAGVAWFCLPVGCCVYGLFHGGLARPLAFVLPPVLSERLPWPAAWSAWGTWLKVPLSVIVGALTHIAWDACTHKYGFFVERVPGLKLLLFRLAGYNFYVYKILQYLSGILGMAVLGGLIWRWWRKASPRPQTPWVWSSTWRRPLRLALLIVPSLAAIVAASSRTGDLDFPMLLRHLVIVGGQVFVLMVGLMAVAWWASERFVTASVAGRTDSGDS